MYRPSKRCASGAIRSFLSLAAIGAIVSSGPHVAASSQPLAGASLGEGSVARPVDRVLDAMPLATAVKAGPPTILRRPANGLTDKAYAALKARLANVRLVPTKATEYRGAAPSRPGLGTQTPVARGFNAINETCSNETPSDMGLAVGSGYVLQAVNSCIAVYTKAGALQTGYPKSLAAFVGLPAGTFTFDPRALYD